MVEQHNHNGMNSDRVDYNDLTRKPDIILTEVVAGSGAQTLANYDQFFIAPYKCEVIGCDEIHTTAGSDAGVVQLQLERRQGVETKGNGDNLLQTAFNLKGTAQTVQNGDVVEGSTKILDKNDRLGVIPTGNLTALVHVVVTVRLKRLDYNE